MNGWILKVKNNITLLSFCVCRGCVLYTYPKPLTLQQKQTLFAGVWKIKKFNVIYELSKLKVKTRRIVTTTGEIVDPTVIVASDKIYPLMRWIYMNSLTQFPLSHVWCSPSLYRSLDCLKSNHQCIYRSLWKIHLEYGKSQ